MYTEAACEALQHSAHHRSSFVNGRSLSEVELLMDGILSPSGAILYRKARV